MRGLAHYTDYESNGSSTKQIPIMSLHTDIKIAEGMSPLQTAPDWIKNDGTWCCLSVSNFNLEKLMSQHDNYFLGQIIACLKRQKL